MPAVDRPILCGGRRRQPEPERGNLGPRDGILSQTVSRLPVANQDFLGFWPVDIHREGRSQRSAAQRRLTAQLRLRNRAAGTGRREDAAPTWGERARQAPGHPSCSDLGTNRTCAFVEYRDPDPERLRPGKGPATQGPPQTVPSRAACSLSSVDGESTHARAGANPGWARRCERSPHMPVRFVCRAPPSPQHD